MLSSDKKVLISGGGIAGLTLGILLKENGWDPLVIERDPALRTEGFMLVFFGTGWDVAERMGFVEDIANVHYPIDHLEFVDTKGNPVFPAIPIDRLRQALGGKFSFLRRQDLERILFNRSMAAGVPVRFGTTIQSVNEDDTGVNVTFHDGTSDAFQLLFGADGIHSRVRQLLFGKDVQFARFIGYYAVGYHASRHGCNLRRALSLCDGPGCAMWSYPVDDRHMDLLYVFRHARVEHLSRYKRLDFARERLKGCGWMAKGVLGEATSESIYFDAMTQIVMPAWHKGRTALLGDACGCLTLAAAQGSHMAMAGAYVIANELERCHGDYRCAFSAYERFMRPFIQRKQAEAKWIARLLVPSSQLRMVIQYPLLRTMSSEFFIGHVLASVGIKSVLDGYR